VGEPCIGRISVTHRGERSTQLACANGIALVVKVLSATIKRVDTSKKWDLSSGAWYGTDEYLVFSHLRQGVAVVVRFAQLVS
jgi:hypothetical protein